MEKLRMAGRSTGILSASRTDSSRGEPVEQSGASPDRDGFFGRQDARPPHTKMAVLRHLRCWPHSVKLH